jgi:hypothetical protein
MGLFEPGGGSASLYDFQRTIRLNGRGNINALPFPIFEIARTDILVGMYWGFKIIESFLEKIPGTWPFS